MFDYLKGENNRNSEERYKVGIFIVELVREMLLGRSNEDCRTVGPWEVSDMGLGICRHPARNLKSNT